MNLRPDEVEITGAWIFEGGRVRGDAACDRIEQLLAGVLQRLGASADSGGWDTLYRDPADGRFWEHTYPRSYMHGGGPPKLATIPRDEAIRRYGRAMVEAAEARSRHSV